MNYFLGDGDGVWTLDEAINGPISERVELDGREGELKNRLIAVIDKVRLLEDFQISSKDKLSSTLRPKTSEEVPGAVLSPDEKYWSAFEDFLPTMIYDFGGQDRFYSVYRSTFQGIQGIAFIRDSKNTKVSEIALRQLAEECEHANQEKGIEVFKSHSYFLTKTDMFYLDDERLITSRNPLEDDLSIFTKEDIVIPTSSFNSFGNFNVKAGIAALILKNINESTQALNVGVAGAPNGGKTSLIQKYLSLILDKPELVKPTELTPGPQPYPLALNSSIFYARKNRQITFVDESKNPSFNFEINYGDDTKIEVISMNDLTNNEQARFDFGWGSILELLRSRGMQPVYDLETIIGVAQYMIPSRWGYENLTAEPFRTKPEYLESIYQPEAYREEYRKFITEN